MLEDRCGWATFLSVLPKTYIHACIRAKVPAVALYRYTCHVLETLDARMHLIYYIRYQCRVIPSSLVAKTTFFPSRVSIASPVIVSARENREKTAILGKGASKSPSLAVKASIMYGVTYENAHVAGR